jgi:DNA polymerase
MPKRPKPGAADLIPNRPTLAKVRDTAKDCRACDLWKLGTQTVFGEGFGKASIMFVGEQPGNEEDLAGHPFVGPAGRLLDRALADAGIDRATVYVTNVVKHFKWKPQGKRRIHQTPRAEEIKACAPWLEAELEVVEPELLVCLGATAVKAVIGSKARVMKDHGEFLESRLGRTAVPTLHPSAILRADPKDREDAMALLIGDLKRVRKRLGS